MHKVLHVLRVYAKNFTNVENVFICLEETFNVFHYV